MLFFHLLNIVGIVLVVISILTSAAIFSLSGGIILLLSTNSIIHRRSGSRDIFSPLFVSTIVFIISCSIGAPLLYLNSAYPEDILNKALVYTIFFVASFVLGFTNNIGDALAGRIPRLRGDFSKKRLMLVTILFLPVGIALYIILMWKAGIGGGLRALNFENLMLFRRSWGSYGWAYVMALSLFFVEAPFWAWFLMKNRTKWFNFILGAYFILIVAIWMGTGTRGYVFFGLLGVFFIYHCRTKAISIFKALASAVLLLIPISTFYVIQGTLRGIDKEINIGEIVQAVSDFSIREVIFTFVMRFIDAFSGFVNILLHSSQLKLLWGASFYYALFMPIPRGLMPEKPYLFNTLMLYQIHPELFGRFYGTEFSIMGELYMNFHIPGLFLGGFLFGILIKLMQRYYMGNQTNINFLFLYRPLILLPFAWFVSGLINSDANIILMLNLFFGFIFFKLVWSKKGNTCQGCRGDN